MNDVPTEIMRVRDTADAVHSAAAVRKALDVMALAITRVLAERNPLVLCIMNGGLVPAGWLAERLTFPFQMDYIHATRYRGATKGSELRWIARPRLSLRGRAVLLIDDILDEGVTLARIVEACRAEGAAQVYSAVLVRKRHNRNRENAQADFVGLEVDDRYVFGCGMDYKHYWRNLPAIYAVND